MARAQTQSQTAVQRVSPEFELPSFIKPDAYKDVNAALQEFIVPPRLKIVQTQSGRELQETFPAGTMIIAPVQAQIVEKGGVIRFTPIIFYPEWVTWNPIELKGQENAIAYRTTDPSDPVVAKAKDARLRKEPFNPPRRVKDKEVFQHHVEHLNFVCVLHEHPFEDPFIMSFSRAEHFVGSQFAAKIKMRKAPMFGCVFEGTAADRKNAQGEWIGLDIGNPTGASPWVTEEQFRNLETVHNEWKELISAGRVKADLENDVPVEPGAPADANRTM